MIWVLKSATFVNLSLLQSGAANIKTRTAEDQRIKRMFTLVYQFRILTNWER